MTLLLLTVAALLPIANPFSTAALFISLTQDDSSLSRSRTARQTCIYVFFILGFFLIAGTVVMRFFGISEAGIRVAGGLIILVVGFRMLFPAESPITPKEQSEALNKKDIALVPLALPSLSGPGSIAVVLSIAADTTGIIDHLFVLLGIFVVAVFSYFVLLGASKLTKYLGVGGINVFSRLMGFFLICIAVQFLAKGVHGFMIDPNF
ncbi:MAG TPA: MarC family NAAT transporter [bacterium]|nr:MarC family NAAT transporter [bacterium]